MSAKRKAPQKAVHDDNVTRDIDRTQISSYNLRPRKRNYPPEDEAQAAGVSSLDRDRGSSVTAQVLGKEARRPTPFPAPCRQESGSGAESASKGKQSKTKRFMGKTGRNGHQRKRRKILSNSEKQILRDTRTALFQSKYKEMFMIGCGGFGDVFAGCRIKDNLPVAIKHIPQRNIYSKLTDQHGNRIPMEVALMQKLSWQPVGTAAHLQLLEWYDLFNKVILVLERPVPCVDLFHYCRYRSNRALEEDEAKAIMKQLIEEVKCFDAEGIFHRDLKLENVLINTSSGHPRIWVIDFGVGCFYTKRSVYRIFQGTPQHVPPEYNFQGRYQAGPTTVWQLGVVLYEMLHEEDFSTVPFLLNRQLVDTCLSNECLDFLGRCLKVFPMERPTLEELEFHPWFSQTN